MKKYYWINYILYTILQWSWGIIQNICGLTLWLILKVKNIHRSVSYYHGAIVTEWDFPSSMGLGMFIFLGHRNLSKKDTQEILVHEYGHTIQSCILGPLFLLVIGIPSFTWAFLPKYRKMRREKGISYFEFYPEKWANHKGEQVLKNSAPKR